MSVSEDRLRAVAARLREYSTPDPEASPHYEWLSDAILWSDENPRVESPADVWCIIALRPVWHARTRLLLGKPLEKFEEDWVNAQAIIPFWVGLIPDRCSPDNLPLVEFARQQLAMASRELEKCERLMNWQDIRDARSRATGNSPNQSSE